MVAVDFNILTGIVVILSVLAYIFVLRRMKTKQPNPIDAAISTKTDEETKLDDKETTELQQPAGSPKKKLLTECGHRYGYLSSLSKKSNPPRECLECSRMTRCMSRKRPRKTRDKRVEAVLAIDEETEFLKQ
jgi:hypothetical protein